MTTMRESLAAKMTAGAIAVVMTLSAFSTFAQTANAATDIEELCALAASLGISTPEFDALCAGDSEDDSAGAGEYVHHPSIDFEFTRNLYIGDRGNDVMMLQRVLNQDPDTQLAASGVGSAGMETEYFGELTRAAVAKFQAKHGISPAAGYFYPLTRAEMNRKAAGSSDDDDDDSSDDDVTGDTLEVEAGDQPDDMQVTASQQHVPTTVVEMTTGDENVDISEITAEVTGDGRDAVDSVSVWYDGMIVDTDSVNSNDVAELSLDMEIDDDETIELVFSVTMEGTVTNEDNLDFQLEVTDIDAGDTDVDGLPIDGAEHTVRSNLDMNTFTMDIDTESTDVEIGDDDELLTTVNFENDDPNNDNDSMFVVGFSLEQDGTMSAGDIDNVYVEVDGEDYDAEWDGDYLRFDFGSGIEIEEDEDEDFEIYADIVDGATETISFSLDDDDLVDMVYVVDEDDRYLAETDATVNDGGAEDNSLTIKAGSGDSSDSNEVADDEITAGADDAEFASFDLDVEGESITGDIDVKIDVATSSNTDQSDIELTGIKIVDTDGNTVASADDDATSVDGIGFDIDIDFEDITFPVGDETYILVADVNDDAPDGTTYTVSQINFSSFEGDDSDEDVTDPSDLTPGTVQTVEGAALAIGVDGTLEDDDTRDDVDGVELGVVQLDATDSGEDVEVTEINLDFTMGLSNTGVYSDVTNCVLVNEDGDEVSDEVDLSAETDQEFDMDSGVVVAKNTVMTLSVQCDLNDDFATNDTITVTADAANSEAEADVAGDVTPTNGNTTGDAVTIVAAEVTGGVDEDPENDSVRTGTTVDLGSIDLDSDNVDGVLEELPLSITGRSLLNSQDKVTIKDAEGDVVAYAYFTSDNIVVDDFEKDVMMEDEKKTVLYFEAELGAGTVATEGDDLFIELDGATNVKVDGDTYSNHGTSTLATVDVYSGLPVITEEDITNSDLSDDVVMKFAIQAEGEDVVLASTTATSVSVTGSATTGVVNINYSTSDYDDAVNGTALTSATNDLTIDEGDTVYFVVEGNNVSDGDNGDTIQTTIDFDGAFTVNSTAIEDVKGDNINADLNNSEELVYKYTN